MNDSSPDVWTLKSQIRSGVLLLKDDDDLVLEVQPPASLRRIRFSKPERIEQPIVPAQALCVNLAHWKYDVTIEFVARDPREARQTALKRLDDLVETLSFLGSVPVSIEKRGTLTNCPEDPISGKEYILIQDGDLVTISARVPTLDEKDVRLLATLLASESTSRKRRSFSRALHWLHHSHFATTVEDQFVGMMIAFEALAPILSDDQQKFWECRKCGHEQRECGSCKESTAMHVGTTLAMKLFACGRLGWSPQTWKSVSRIRNHLLHGGSADEDEVIALLPEVEAAVLRTIRFILRMPDDAAPKELRSRSQLKSAGLTLKYTAP